jgi:cardiolipin synthase
MNSRTPQGAIAWAVSLNTFPYVAVPAYWVFGSFEFDDYLKARSQARLESRRIENELRASLKFKDLVVPPDGEWGEVLAKLAELPFTDGNSASLLVNGGETYASLLDGIKHAENYILFQFYIIRDDKVGQQFRDALVAKAQQGVRVYAMYDEVGSIGLPDSFKSPLIKAGGHFIPFNTTQGFGNRFRKNFRNHRKVMVVDGREAWVGGINIGEEYKNSGPSDPAVYMRDTHIKMAGPIVQMVQATFMEDWYWAAKSLPKLNWEPERSTSGSIKMLCLPTGPSTKLDACALFFITAINKAKERVWISTPYFVPDQQIKSALALAVLRGVDVRIMIPEETDSKLIDMSHLGIMGEMADTGVHIYSYKKGFIHQKVMLVDDQYSFVGTANFDNRSFRLNFEITMMADDVEFAKKTETMLNEDFSHAEIVAETKFEKSSYVKRLLARTALLLSPIQ